MIGAGDMPSSDLLLAIVEGTIAMISSLDTLYFKFVTTKMTRSSRQMLFSKRLLAGLAFN